MIELILTIFGSVPFLAMLYLLFIKGITKNKSDEIKKLIQVPILKKDLNRVLKVCASYDSQLAVYFHRLVLKSRRPHEIDLSFQECLSEAKLYKEKFVSMGIPARIFTSMMFLLSLSLGHVGAACFVGLFYVAFEFEYYHLKSNINYETVVLFQLRNLLYSNLEEGNFVPPRYRPKVLSKVELDIYKKDIQAFNDGIAEKRKTNPNLGRTEVLQLFEGFDEKQQLEDYQKIEDAV